MKVVGLILALLTGCSTPAEVFTCATGGTVKTPADLLALQSCDKIHGNLTLELLPSSPVNITRVDGWISALNAGPAAAVVFPRLTSAAEINFSETQATALNFPALESVQEFSVVQNLGLTEVQLSGLRHADLLRVDSNSALETFDLNPQAELGDVDFACNGSKTAVPPDLTARFRASLAGVIFNEDPSHPTQGTVKVTGKVQVFNSQSCG